MLVLITRVFDDENGRRWYTNENPDVPPDVARRWITDGNAILDPDGVVNSDTLSGGETAALRSALTGQFVGAQYDGQGRLVYFERAGVPHTVAYPNATTAVIQNSTGGTRTVTIDGSGRVTSIV